MVSLGMLFLVPLFDADCRVWCVFSGFMLVSVFCPCVVLTMLEVKQWRIRVLVVRKSALTVIDRIGFDSNEILTNPEM